MFHLSLTDFPALCLHKSVRTTCNVSFELNDSENIFNQTTHETELLLNQCQTETKTELTL